ncbi:hypothetical protein MUA90_12785 [Staphylococcus sp. IVB6181]|uniref:hypothetical protein n=1 Tax=Staphylococcus sp. IVB6181 TaxID=2929481 RepID=UPI0021D2C033|nr:hypothetical protein [Staphylococcus sp. IVB6181]UXV34850.1 hypothetical protein MUA90_12785 [Staphylococcus sp. IVB6181]
MKKLSILLLTVIILITVGCSKGDPLPRSVKNDMHKSEQKMDVIKIFKLDRKNVVYDKDTKKLTLPLQFNDPVELPADLVRDVAVEQYSDNKDVKEIIVKYELNDKKYNFDLTRDKHGKFKKMK